MHRRSDEGDRSQLSQSLVRRFIKSPIKSLTIGSCFVRARRLNVIIQPHLRFVYELMKWDEIQQEAREQSIKRDLEWPQVAREIAAMNRPYARN
jgi:hypothetical protein